MNIKITNLDEYGIDLASIAGFLNEYCYTDCNSWLLYNVSGDKAMAVSVERDFKPEFVPGGFSAICVNNEKQHLAPIKITGTPVELIKRKGEWGRWVVKNMGGLYPPESYEKLVALGHTLHRCEDGWSYPIELTKTGKPRMTFAKYGKSEKHCAAFHDYNF